MDSQALLQKIYQDTIEDNPEPTLFREMVESLIEKHATMDLGLAGKKVEHEFRASHPDTPNAIFQEFGMFIVFIHNSTAE